MQLCAIKRRCWLAQVTGKPTQPSTGHWFRYDFRRSNFGVVKAPQIKLLIFHNCSKQSLTQWGRVTHIWSGNSDNGLSPSRRQVLTWITAQVLSIGPLGTNLIEIRIKIRNFSFMKMRLKVSSANRWSFWGRCANKSAQQLTRREKW